MTNQSETLLTALETELHQQIARLDESYTQRYHEMLTYHMGWTGEGADSAAGGKRLRPLLTLLVNIAAGGDWEKALPAAAAIELLHNFSLLHDDIQDNSPLRRGRPTVWTIWGIPQAINAGDGMFILANLAMGDLAKYHPAETALQGERLFQEVCLSLTRGQHLDLDFETRTIINSGDYWKMISGKTAVLIGFSAQIGALLAGADEGTQNAYRDFGHYLGLAFQIQDDILGIWGDEAITGKSAASDLLEGKKSLPVLYGFEKGGTFAKRWQEGSLTPEEIPAMARTLEKEGIKLETQRQADQMTDMALKSLLLADPQGEAGENLFATTQRLLGREA